MDGALIKLTIFLVISGFLLSISWRSLRVVRSHGFYRFFAWEAILALILLNIHAWFSDPFSPLQLVSWMLLVVSLVWLGCGLYMIRLVGKPGTKRIDESLFAFEKTSALVTSGIFRYIRHPLYGSLLFLAWGAFLKGVSWYSFVLVFLATLFLVWTASADEAECIREFGSSYEEYMKRSKMFVPLLF